MRAEKYIRLSKDYLFQVFQKFIPVNLSQIHQINIKFIQNIF